MIQHTAIELFHRSSLGGKGDRPEQFQVRLAGIDIAGENLLAIGDREIKRFSFDGTLKQRIATRDAGWCVASAGGNLWVGMQGAIDRLDEEGRVIETLSDPTRMGRITSLACHHDLVFAADSSNRTIHLFRNGVWQREVGQDANTRGFMIPNGVLDLVLDVHRNVLIVAHSQKHRVERYDLEGKYIDSFGRFGVDDPAGFGGCCNPTNVAVLGENIIATSLKAPAGIKLYSSNGQFLTQIIGSPFDPNTKNVDIAGDGRRRLYASDPLRCTIEVFQIQTSGLE